MEFSGSSRSRKHVTFPLTKTGPISSISITKFLLDINLPFLTSIFLRNPLFGDFCPEKKPTKAPHRQRHHWHTDLVSQKTSCNSGVHHWEVWFGSNPGFQWQIKVCIQGFPYQECNNPFGDFTKNQGTMFWLISLGNTETLEGRKACSCLANIFSTRTLPIFKKNIMKSSLIGAQSRSPTAPVYYYFVCI